MKPFLLTLFLTFPLLAGEVEEVEKIAPKLFPNDHELEARLHDGSRVDILTSQYAIEADWAKGLKWAEAIGQSLYYAEVTGKEPGVLILLKDPVKEYKNLVKVALICGKHDIKLWVIEIEHSP